MDDKQQTAQSSAEAERAKGAALEYDSEDEEALDKSRPVPAADEGAHE